MYHTKQRKALIEYLGLHRHELLSAHDIARALEDCGISVSAVYRNLATLESDGLIVRESSRGKNEALYRYMDEAHCKNVLHLSCKMCKRTFHMEDDAARALEASISCNSAFTIDRSDTVLYGICGDCKNKA